MPNLKINILEAELLKSRCRIAAIGQCRKQGSLRDEKSASDEMYILLAYADILQATITKLEEEDSMVR